MYLLFSTFPRPVILLSVVALGFLAGHVSGAAERMFGDKDPSAVVIDEIVGLQVALFLVTPSVRPNGLGHGLAANLPHGGARGVLALVAVGCLLFGSSGLIALSLAAVTFLLGRRAMLRRLGGTTGDTAGALLELVECTVLVGLALQL